MRIYYRRIYAAHFTDIPFQRPQYDAGSVAASDNDVVHLLEQTTKVLQGRGGAAENPHHLSPREALLLLVHLVGDLHQPLHVGTAYIDEADEIVDPPSQAEIDSGAIQATHGDNYLVYNSKKLHGFWDAQLVKYGMKMASAQSPADYAAYLLQKDASPEHASGDPSGWAQIWVDDTLRVSKSAVPSEVILSAQ